MCLFLSVTGLLLAIYGAGADRARRRFSITMALVLLLLALGSHTPLFRLLYDCAPGFNRFRGMSKFAVQASAFIALLSGIGLDRLIRAAKVDRRLAAAPILLGAALLIAAAWIGAPADPNRPSPGWWRMMRDVAAAQEIIVPPDLYDNAAFARQAQVHAARSLLLAALPCAIAAAGLLYMRSTRRLAFVVAIVAAGEMLLFALSIRPTFHLAAESAAGAEAVLRSPSRRLSSAHPGQPGCRHVVARVWLLGIRSAPARQVCGVRLRIAGKEAGQRHVVFAVSVLLRPGLQDAALSLRDPAERRPGAESRRIPRLDAARDAYHAVSGRERPRGNIRRDADPSVRSGAGSDSRIAA